MWHFAAQERDKQLQARRQPSKGFVERPNHTVLDGFFRRIFRKSFREIVEGLQRDLDDRLLYHSSDGPRQGHRNRRRRPLDTIDQYMQAVTQKTWNCEPQLYVCVLDVPRAGHPNLTVLTTGMAGNRKYDAYENTRSGNVPTDIQFTGQMTRTTGLVHQRVRYLS